MALATAKITEIIDKIIESLNTVAIEGIVGVYFGDQESFSAFPVICVGAPPLLNENFPVMAGKTVRDEIYNIPILLFVKYADTLANKKQFYNLTGAIKDTLRDDNLSGYVYLIEILETRYAYARIIGQDIYVRVSETTIQYTKRIQRD